MPKNFPIMSKVIPFIPWDMIGPHEAQAQHNHSQTLQRLSERGGLSPYEALCVLSGRDCCGRGSQPPFKLPDEREAYEAFNAAEEKKLTDALIAWAVKNGALAEPEAK